MEHKLQVILATVIAVLALSEKAISNNCLGHQFECDHGLCISNSWVCDNVLDCKDMSDEAHCDENTFKDSNATKPCTIEEFECINGACIAKELVCDDTFDCEDESDENEYICNGTLPTPRPCPSGLWCLVEATENTTYLTCIDQDLICDGSVNCLYEEDEQGCPPPTTTTTVAPCSGFVCNITGNCIPYDLVCDGKLDCGLNDTSDEQNCPTTTTPSTTTSFCRGGLVECPEGGVCIEPWWICDGVRDCPLGGDEENCRLTGINLNGNRQRRLPA